MSKETKGVKVTIHIGTTLNYSDNLTMIKRVEEKINKMFGKDSEIYITDELGEEITSNGEFKKFAYDICYFRKDGTQVDSTQVDENSEELIWELFTEFGHDRIQGDYYEVEEVEDHDH